MNLDKVEDLVKELALKVSVFNDILNDLGKAVDLIRLEQAAESVQTKQLEISDLFPGTEIEFISVDVWTDVSLHKVYKIIGRLDGDPCFIDDVGDVQPVGYGDMANIKLVAIMTDIVSVDDVTEGDFVEVVVDHWTDLSRSKRYRVTSVCRTYFELDDDVGDVRCVGKGSLQDFRLIKRDAS